jgi:hypothetical protein
MKPKFEINEVARIMVAGNVIRIHEISLVEDDIGQRDKTFKYTAVGLDNHVFKNLDERMIMKESIQKYGDTIPKAGEIDVSESTVKVPVPIKANKIEKDPPKRKYKKKNYRKRSSKKPKNPGKDSPFDGVPL